MRELRQILDAIRGIVRALRLTTQEAERRLGISGAQLFVLQTLSVTGLAEATRTHQSSVSVVVRKLVDRGLVRRQRAADDARRWELEATAEGRRLLERAPATAQERMVAAARRLPASTRSELARGLGALLEAVAPEGHAPMFFEDEDGREGKKRK